MLFFRGKVCWRSFQSNFSTVQTFLHRFNDLTTNCLADIDIFSGLPLWKSQMKLVFFFSFELFSDSMSSSSVDSEMMLQGSIPFGPFHIVQISSGLFVCLRTTSLDHFRLVAGFRSRPDRWFWRNSKSGDSGYVVRHTILIRRRKNSSMLQFRKSISFVVPDSSRHLFLYCIRY